MKKFVFILSLLLSVSLNAQVGFSPGILASTTVTSVGFTAEYQAVLDAMTVDPQGDTLTWQNALVDSLLLYGYWARMDLLYIFAQKNEQGALLNWIGPGGAFDATNINVTQFDLYEGFTGDGVADHLNTNFDVDSDNTNYTLDDASAGIYLRINQQEDGNFAFGARSSTTEESYLISRTTGDIASGEMHGGSFASPATISNSDGLLISTRTASNATELFYSGSSVDTDTDASNALPNANMGILAKVILTGHSGYSTNQASIFFMMDGMNVTEAAHITDIFEDTYMDPIGKGVIP